jgi:glutaredoxin 3
MAHSVSPAITVYRTAVCPYCVMAGRLLTKRGYAFTEVSLDGKPADRKALEARTDWLTVPQIFVGDRFVGGYTELAALDASGELAALMQGS